MTVWNLTPEAFWLWTVVVAAVSAYITYAATAYVHARRHHAAIVQLIELDREELLMPDDQPFVDYAARYGLTGKDTL